MSIFLAEKNALLVNPIDLAEMRCLFIFGQISTDVRNHHRRCFCFSFSAGGGFDFRTGELTHCFPAVGGGGKNTDHQGSLNLPLGMLKDDTLFVIM